MKKNEQMLKPVLPYRFLSYWFAKSTFLCSQFSIAVQWSVLSYFLTAGCFKILCKGILEIFCFMQIICFIAIRYITRSACDTGAFVFQEILMGTTLSTFSYSAMQISHLTYSEFRVVSPSSSWYSASFKVSRQSRKRMQSWAHTILPELPKRRMQKSLQFQRNPRFEI